MMGIKSHTFLAYSNMLYHLSVNVQGVRPQVNFPES